MALKTATLDDTRPDAEPERETHVPAATFPAMAEPGLMAASV
jgi:hypothetical protein